ncbi:hypothetical protein [Mycolicibacterium cosmeticum]|uniref:hypothetical protein n=1 Tax=Mycolicibacterium cosmeticum TaxID=258533 RepID=UPI003204BDF2
MQVAVRSRLNMGIALAGAGAIAFAPIVQPMPAVAELPARAASSARVALTAAVNPIEQWAKIIQDAVANGGTLAQSYLDNPVPILHQLLLNGMGYGGQTFTALRTAGVNLVEQLRFDNPYGFPAGVRNGLSQIAAGQIYEGTTTLFNAGLGLILGPVGPLLELMQIPVTMAQKVADVVAAVPGVLLGVGFGAIATVNGTIQATSFQAQAVLDALKAGDLMGAVGELVATPGAIVNAVLNGFALTGAPGLLSPGGLIAQVIQGLNTIAQALAPAAPAAKVADTGPSALPSAASSVATITLGTAKPTTADAPKASAMETTEPTATEPAATQPAATEPAETEPTAAEPTTADPETSSAATETKPETKPDAKPETKPETKSETKPEAGTTSGATTPNGGTDMTNGNKAEPGKTGEPGKPSGSTGSEAGPGSAGTGTTSTERTVSGSGSVTSGSGSGTSGPEAGGSGSGATGTAA